jgi:uncharacterized protein
MSWLTLSGLWIYPVKSLGSIALQSGEVEEQGLKFDRRWMVVDEAGQFLTQRQHPRMAALRASIGESLEIVAPSGETLRLPLQPTGPRAQVRVWRDDVAAVDCGDEAARFLSEALQAPCRLVGMTGESHRPIDTRFALNGEITSFADGFPFLIAGQSSLDDLNDRLLEKGEDSIAIERFRPNFLFKGGGAYDEDNWRVFRIGDVEFEVVKPCARCVITTLDQQSGEKRGNEPLQTLGTYRRMNGGVCFAQNVLARTFGTVRVGDEVQALTRVENQP